MYNLITKSLEDSKLDYLLRFPHEIMTVPEKEAVRFITGYNAKHGQLPTVKRLQKEFAWFVSVDTEDPLSDVYEQALQSRRREIATQKTNDILMALDSGSLPEEEINKLAKLINHTAGDYVCYTEYDRDNYFQSGKRLYFGFRLIDKETGGMGRGDLTYIVGKLGTGKTTIAQWIVWQWFTQGNKVMIVSNEMPPVDLFIRFDGMAKKFNPKMVRNKATQGKVKKKIDGIEQSLKGYGGEIIVPRQRLITPSAAFAKAENLGVDALVVDGVYLMQPDERVGSEWARVKEVSNALKQGALDAYAGRGMQVLGTTQLKRLDKDGDYSAEDIAYSNALGQDADFLLALQPENLKVVLDLIKNRYGNEVMTLAQIDFDKMEVTDESALSSSKPGKVTS